MAAFLGNEVDVELKDKCSYMKLLSSAHSDMYSANWADKFEGANGREQEPRAQESVPWLVASSSKGVEFEPLYKPATVIFS